MILIQSSAQDPAFYHLIFTGDTATNTNDRIFHPTSIIYNAGQDKATLTFASDLDQLGSGVGTFRLRIGSADSPPQQGLTEVPIAVNTGVDAGSSYATAQNVTPVTPLGTRSIIVSGEIERQNYGLTLPGSSSEPGHRDLGAETQQGVPGATTHLNGVVDTTDGVTTIFYDFRRDYGVDPLGNQLINVISDAQKQRAREALEFYSHFLGVQFVETNPAPGTRSVGFTIATGDLRAVRPQAATGPGDGFFGVAGVPNVPVINGSAVPVFSIALAVMDNAENWGSSEFGGSWFREAMREVGQILGYGFATDQPDLTLNVGVLPNVVFGNTGEPVFPGDHDIVHGQFMYRPESKDIDLYRFQVTGNGMLRAETFAERLATSSQLDTVLTLFADVKSLVVPAAGAAPAA